MCFKSHWLIIFRFDFMYIFVRFFSSICVYKLNITSDYRIFFAAAAATANSVVAFQIFEYLILSFDVTWRILFISFEHFFQTHFLLKHYLLRNHRVCLELGQHKCQTIWTHIFWEVVRARTIFAFLILSAKFKSRSLYAHYQMKAYKIFQERTCFIRLVKEICVWIDNYCIKMLQVILQSMMDGHDLLSYSSKHVYNVFGIPVEHCESKIEMPSEQVL